MRMRISCWTPKAKDAHSEYIILTIYKEPTWCNLAVCLLVTAIMLYTFRTLFVLYTIWFSAEAIDLGRPHWILHPISCHTPEAATTVFKCCWGWTQKASETCRALLQLLINILPICIMLVLYIYDTSCCKLILKTIQSAAALFIIKAVVFL